MSQAEEQTKRVAIVTGGAKGIGAAISRRLSAAGCRLAIVGRDSAALKAMCDDVKTGGGEVLCVTADLGELGAADEIVKQVEESLGPPDILVNNAGMTRDGLLIRMSTQDFTDVLRVNLTAAFELSRRCARLMMKSRWGRIVNVSSIVAIMGNPGQANYIASKAGLIGLTRALAQELASRNITVNAIAPGFIETDMTASLPEEIKERYRERIPLTRFGSADEVAALVAFLVSDDAGYITGQTLHVDGGLVMA